MPGGRHDLVFARLLLFHLPQRGAVLARLWDAVAPGGCLLVQDYELSLVGTAPSLPGVVALNTLMSDALGAIGCDVRLGAKLPTLFAEGSDIAGALAPLGPSRVMLEQTLRAVLPAVTTRGLVDPERAEPVLTP